MLTKTRAAVTMSHIIQKGGKGMTSIEAVNRIECATDLTKETRWETTVSKPYFGEIQTIRKDLEVLEILKERCARANVTRWGLCKKGEDKARRITVGMDKEKKKKEYEKVMEWIER